MRRGCSVGEFRLETERLVLRDWRDCDLNPFAKMSADPVVMATLGPLMSSGQATALIEELITISNNFGHTFWALERLEDQQFIGWCGIIRGDVEVINGKLEIGWRLASDSWGKGYAREAAEASLGWAFANLPDNRVWAITSAGNSRSWGLMERLGMMRHSELDFDHPDVSDGSPLKPHVTYSIAKSVR